MSSTCRWASSSTYLYFLGGLRGLERPARCQYCSILTSSFASVRTSPLAFARFFLAIFTPLEGVIARPRIPPFVRRLVLGHCQTKGEQQANRTFCYRATFRLYRMLAEVSASPSGRGTVAAVLPADVGWRPDCPGAAACSK